MGYSSGLLRQLEYTSYCEALGANSAHGRVHGLRLSEPDSPSRAALYASVGGASHINVDIYQSELQYQGHSTCHHEDCPPPGKAYGRGRLHREFALAGAPRRAHRTLKINIGPKPKSRQYAYT